MSQNRTKISLIFEWYLKTRPVFRLFQMVWHITWLLPFQNYTIRSLGSGCFKYSDLSPALPRKYGKKLKDVLNWSKSWNDILNEPVWFFKALSWILFVVFLFFSCFHEIWVAFRQVYHLFRATMLMPLLCSQHYSLECPRQHWDWNKFSFMVSPL